MSGTLRGMGGAHGPDSGGDDSREREHKAQGGQSAETDEARSTKTTGR